jgi:uncharacterized membrane protein
MTQIKILAKRHLAKTLTYRITSTLIGGFLMWLATDNIVFGALFGVTELVIKPLLYYYHERLWYRFIRFGLVEIPPVINSEPITIETPSLLTEISEVPQPKIKRLTYTKRSD